MIPLSVPNISGNEWKYIKDCLDTNWVSSVGSYVDQFEKSIQEYTGAKYAVAASSGTSALHIALILSGVGPEDGVIVPNLTFIATLNAVKYTGATPILIDVDKDTWQIDLDLVEKFFKENTIKSGSHHVLKSNGKKIRCFMPVHILGNMCSMDRVLEIANTYNLTIIEDAAEALGAFYNGKHAGTFGKIGCFSFNGNKIITTGGGGMLVTNDAELAKRAKHLTTQAKADPFEYYHDEIGYNYRLVNVLAAMGVAQMEQLSDFIARKKWIADLYEKNLDLPGITFQKIPMGVKPNNWLFTIITPHQKKLIEALTKEKVQVRPFWVPMNQLPMFKDDYYYTDTNVSHELYTQSLSLPCSTNIREEEIMKTVGIIRNTIA